MDLKSLQTFLTLSKTLNYQRASEILQYAPSSLAKHIKLLEEELGTQLFKKEGRQLQLTADGTSFIAHAQRILADYHQAMANFANNEKTIDSVRIGGCELNASYSLFSVFSSFQQTHPDARLHIHSSPNAAIPDMIKNKLLDVGFYYSIIQDPLPGLCSQYLYQEPLYILVSPSHPLVSQRGLCYESLAGLPLSFPHDSCALARELLHQIRSHGVQLGEITYLGGYHMCIMQAHEKNAGILATYSSLNRLCTMFDLKPLDLIEEPIWAWKRMLFSSHADLSPSASQLVRHCTLHAQRQLSDDPVHYRAHI